MKYDTLFLICGNSLFYNHISKNDSNTVYFMAEDIGLCSRYRYHKHKILYLLSAMRSHRDELSENNNVEYYNIDCGDSSLNYEQKLLKLLKKYNIKLIKTYDIENSFFRDRIIDFCRENGIELNIINSPGFITTHTQFSDYMKSHKKLFMNDFYIWQRKRLKLLLDKGGGPVNGSWSFDQSNRKKLPKNINIPELPVNNRTAHTEEVAKLVNSIFPENPGSTDNFYLPTTRSDALDWMENFFESRFNDFGPYQDAISQKHAFNFHSVLSPLLNTGLITPDTVISRALEYRDKVPYQSLEGFIRQIVGWREFMRGVYNHVDLKGNFFNHDKRMNHRWYDANTGLPPLDLVISRVKEFAYAHHIERLMVLSNLMLLCEIHPDDVNRWFSELFIDAYDWVMEPNVYGMGQFADGGVFATKPYISGSNYILKMSDFKKGDWCDIWDGLYWRFIYRNKDFFKTNPRMSLMVGTLNRIPKDRKSRIFKLADNFIEGVTV